MGKRLAAAGAAATSNNHHTETSQKHNNNVNKTTGKNIDETVDFSRSIRKRKYNGNNNSDNNNHSSTSNNLSKKIRLQNNNADNYQTGHQEQQEDNCKTMKDANSVVAKTTSYYEHVHPPLQNEKVVNSARKATDTNHAVNDTRIQHLSKACTVMHHIKPEGNDSPRQVYSLRPSIVNGTLLRDLKQRLWRLGQPIGKGNFGEIFLASDNISVPVTSENARFVVKMEPHSNGPLFVEIHCLMNTARTKMICNKSEMAALHIKKEEKGSRNDEEEGESNRAAIANSSTSNDEENDDEDEIKPYLREVRTEPPTGIPEYVSSGSHTFSGTRYRFLVLPRYERDLHSLIKNSRVDQKHLLILAIQIINVLEKLHDKGYCHNDIKAQNLMISKCKYLQQQRQSDDEVKKFKVKEEQQKNTNTFNVANNTQSKEGKTTTTTMTMTKKKKNTGNKCRKYELNDDEKLPTTDSGNSSEQDDNFIVRRTARMAATAAAKTASVAKYHQQNNSHRVKWSSRYLSKDCDDYNNISNNNNEGTTKKHNLGVYGVAAVREEPEMEDSDEITTTTTTGSRTSNSNDDHPCTENTVTTRTRTKTTAAPPRTLSRSSRKRSTSQQPPQPLIMDTITTPDNSIEGSSGGGGGGASSKVQYSGSNPMRSCRRDKEQSHEIYEEMVNSHYLRPAKRVSYLEFFAEDNSTASTKAAVQTTTTTTTTTTSTKTSAKNKDHNSIEKNNSSSSRQDSGNSSVVRKQSKTPTTTKKDQMKNGNGNGNGQSQRHHQSNKKKKNYTMKINSSDDDGDEVDDDDCDFLQFLSRSMRQRITESSKSKSPTGDSNCKRSARLQALQQKRVMEEIQLNNYLQCHNKPSVPPLILIQEHINYTHRICCGSNNNNSSIWNEKSKLLVKEEIKQEAKEDDDKEELEAVTDNDQDDDDDDQCFQRTIEEERVFLIDFGLASKYIDNGIHRPFVMDQRRAHDGTLEFTSRDAHMGAHSRRSDMECLGYNLLFWSEGYLPWKDAANLQQQEKVHRAKEYLMTDVREMLKQIYGPDIPKYLGEFLHLVGQLSYHERPDYDRYRQIFKNEYKQRGYKTTSGESQETEMTASSTLNKKSKFNARNNQATQEKSSSSSATAADDDGHQDDDDQEEFCLSMSDIQMSCKPFDVKEVETTGKTDFFEMARTIGTTSISLMGHSHFNHLQLHQQLPMMTGAASCVTPYNDRTLMNRVSPKNLRSKSDKKQMKRKQFSWTEILSQDPDQIARQRAEKEFDREDELSETQQTTIRRYEGKPTYAILQILQRVQRCKDQDSMINGYHTTAATTAESIVVAPPRNGIVNNGNHNHHLNQSSSYQRHNEMMVVEKGEKEQQASGNNHHHHPRLVSIPSNDNYLLHRYNNGNKLACNNFSTPLSSLRDDDENDHHHHHHHNRVLSKSQKTKSKKNNNNATTNTNTNTITTTTTTSTTIAKLRSGRRPRSNSKEDHNANEVKPQNDAAALEEKSVETVRPPSRQSRIITTPALNASTRRYRRQPRRCLDKECQEFHNNIAYNKNNNNSYQQRLFLDDSDLGVAKLDDSMTTDEHDR